MQRAPLPAVTFPFASLLLALTLAACASGPSHDEPTERAAAALGSAGAGGTSGACKSAGLAVLDLHGDMREIWKGLEQPDTGKQANSRPVVTLDFNAGVQSTAIAATFTPAVTDGSCGPIVAANAATSLVPTDVWGQLTTDTARQPLPSPFNVLVRDQISGIVNAAGPIAAGADVTLSSMSVNGTTREPVGLIAGGKVTLTSGSIAGDVTYGTASTIPGTVTMSGKKSLLPFDPSSAFQKLEALSALLDELPLTGSATLTNGTLQLAGTKAGTNVFRVTADQLRQATNLVVSAPAGSGVLIGVAGSSVDLQNKGVTLTGVGAGTVLWNFPAASNVNVSGIALSGSLFAPRAAFQFASGSVNGTVVARSFIGAGSGTLQYTRLNVSLLLGASAPNAVDLTPASALHAGCSYRLSMPATQPLNAGGACLAAPFGVTFRVAGSDASPTARELVHVEVDSKTKLLRRFTARDGINTRVDDVWKRYEPGPGISAAELLPVGTAHPSSTRPGQVVQVYQQYAQGYPIAGFGYFVTSQGGIFRGANGKVIAGLPSFPAPSVSAATALQNVLTYLKITQPPWVSTPAKYRAPAGSLVLLAKKSNPATGDFVLAWTFKFDATSGISDPEFIAIDAATGGVAGLGAGTRSATGLNANATFNGLLSNSTVDTVYNGRQTDLLTAQYKNPDGSLVAVLATNDVRAGGAMIATAGSLIAAKGPPQGTPDYVTDPTPGTTWTTDAVERRAASLLWGLERANTFLQSLNLQVDGLAWQAVDGVGRQQLFINLADAPTIASSAYSSISSPDRADIYAWGKQQVYAVEADTPAHEYGHVLLANLRRTAGLDALLNYKESGSIDEGLADLFAIARERHQGSVTPDWYCLHVEADATSTKCWRNTLNPFASVFGVPLSNPGQPNLYLDTNDFYQDFRDTPVANCGNDALGIDRCGVHLNSTIVSHWGYLLAVGSAGITTVPCDLSVAPLDPSSDTSFHVLLGIAYEAARRIGLSTGGDATFADFRDATLQVAEEGLAQGTLSAAQVETIGLAWSAVGLPPLSSDHSAAQPADGSFNVNPWVTFAWPANGEGQQGTRWDFELADGPFETNLLYHQEGIGQLSDSGAPMYTFSLALPSRSSSTYYWRVRPQSPGAWASCYPIHTFSGTGDVPPLADLRLFSRTDADGHVPPGVADIAWTTVAGAQKYAIDAAPVDPNCTPGAGVLSSSAPQDSSGNVVHTVHTLAGGEHYFVDVHAVGPPGLDGVPAAGECEKIELDTALPKAPVLEAPVDGTTINDHASASFSWTVSAGTNQTEIQFYELDENDQCSKVGPAPDVVSTPCSDDECPGKLVDRAFPHPNPSGYCWVATAITKNGARGGASAPNKLRFYHDQTVKLSPGIERNDQALTTAALTDPYGSDVTFTWRSDPDALKYGFRVWPYSFTDHQESEIDPLNCAVHGTSPPGPWTNCSRPRGSVDYETPDGATSVTVPGDVADMGRYCWNVWPELADPNHPNQVDSRQPFVVLDEENCYTSPPARPTITVDNPPGPDYGGEPVTGHVFFPYVPDGQWQVDCIDAATQESVIEFSQGVSCTPDYPFTYADTHECTVPFTLKPAPNKAYLVVARTWNSDLHPPLEDETTQMPDVVEPIQAPDCGNLGQQCCDRNIDNAHCTEFKTWCDSNETCSECGNAGEHCCLDPNHRYAWYCPYIDGQGPRLGCNGALECETCGKTGRACCYEEDNGTHYCTENVSDNCNENLKCGQCGKRGQICCFTDGNTRACEDGLDCKTIAGKSDRQCLPPCGSEGDTCCTTDPQCESGHSCDSATNTCKPICGAAGEPCCKVPQGQSGTGCDSTSECLGGVCEGRCTKPPGIVTGLQAPPGSPAVPNGQVSQYGCLAGVQQGPYAKTVTWDPVPGAKGYIVYAQGNQEATPDHYAPDQDGDGLTKTFEVPPQAANVCRATTVWVRAFNDCGLGDFDEDASSAVITWTAFAF